MSLALFFSGGGARAAYQAGVATGILDIAAKQKTSPFQILSGLSAGAINAAYIAQHANCQKQAAQKLTRFWSDLTFDMIYRIDSWALAKNSLRWISDVSLGSLKPNKKALALLDSSPLYELLNKRLHPQLIQRQVARGNLHSYSCQAFDYNSGKLTTFLQTSPHFKAWNLAKREAKLIDVTNRHIYASCSIPLVFPPVLIDGHHLADGALRNSAPLSPVIRAGAQKMLIIGVEKGSTISPNFTPSLASVISAMLQSLFFDSLDSDIERLSYINKTIQSTQTNNSQFRVLEYLYIKPSEEITDIAEKYIRNFPRGVRFLMEGLGSRRDIAELSSYLLFWPTYLQDLIALGREDAAKKIDEIQGLLLTQ